MWLVDALVLQMKKTMNMVVCVMGGRGEGISKSLIKIWWKNLISGFKIS